ncbi:MAG: hypothetical protein AAB391_02075 [Patescibacteria group bacterium]
MSSSDHAKFRLSPISLEKLTDSQIKRLVASSEITLFEVLGRYIMAETIEEGTRIVSGLKDRVFYSKSINDHFSIDEITLTHLFGKIRLDKDYLRRARLLASGIEIAEDSMNLVVVDAKTDADKGIVYYEILGSDRVRFPEKIIRVKISEMKPSGKKLWTVVDISVLKNNTPPQG